MTSAEPAAARPRRPRGWLFALLLAAGPAGAADVGVAAPEVWLVTYGPGQIYWQRFGHNAIWIRDPDLGLDHTFNFGFFDFEQEGFFLRFLIGRMLYFSAAQPAAIEFAQYIDENRAIRAQRLALTAGQALALADSLLEQVQPEKRDYLYDYYLDNCSTRVRDALDHALGGRLAESSMPIAAAQDFRDHTRRLTEPDFWLYLGLELGLGATVDRPISRWDEYFIPAELADGIAGLTTGSGPDAAQVVLEDVVIHAVNAAPPPAQPGRVWPRYLLAAAGLLALVAFPLRQLRPARRVAALLARTWLSIAGLAGCALLFFWFATDHAAAAYNLNLLLFNPLWLLGAAARRFARPVAVMLVAMGAMAVAAQFLPPHQYVADVLAAFLPLHLAAAAVLYRADPKTPGG